MVTDGRQGAQDADLAPIPSPNLLPAIYHLPSAQEEPRAQGARCIIIVCNHAGYHFDVVHPIHPE